VSYNWSVDSDTKRKAPRGAIGYPAPRGALALRAVHLYVRTQPMKRSYYATLRKRSRDYTLRMDKKQWCDLHHQHFDWDGKGDTGFAHRIRHLNALLRALRNVRNELRSYQQPYQLFAYVDLKSSADDALYVHTPNPNGTEFPCPIDSESEPATAPPLLAARLDLSLYEIRRKRSPDGSVYYIVPRTRAS
jgi:hypothetical protein